MSVMHRLGLLLATTSSVDDAASSDSGVDLVFFDEPSDASTASSCSSSSSSSMTSPLPGRVATLDPADLAAVSSAVFCFVKNYVG